MITPTTGMFRRMEQLDVNQFMQTLGRTIQGERIKRRLTRADLAERSGVGEKQVGKIERGEAGQSVEVWRIIRALGLSPSAVISEAESSPQAGDFRRRA